MEVVHIIGKIKAKRYRLVVYKKDLEIISHDNENSLEVSENNLIEFTMDIVEIFEE